MTARQLYETYAAAFVHPMPTWDQLGTKQLAWHSLADAIESKIRETENRTVSGGR